MPRKLSEWRKIRNNYYKAQYSEYLRDGDESVVYLRESNNVFWEFIRQRAESQVPLTVLDYSTDKVTELFRQIAAQERQKELLILQKFLPAEEVQDTDTLIDKINILMQNRKRYNQLLERMQRALSQERSSGAPNMSSFFATYLEPILIQKMELFKNEFINLDNPKERYIQLVKEAMQEASTKMATASPYNWNPGAKKYTTTKSTAGGREDWLEINTALKNIPGMWDLFTRNVMKSIGNWDKLYSTLIGDNINSTTSNVQNLLKLKDRTFSIGGNVAENAYAAVSVRLNGLRGGNGSISYAVSGGALTVEGPATADSFLIFSANSEISPTSIFEELNSATNATYKEKLNNTINEFKNNLNDLFGIFVNAKNYSIGTSQDATYTKTMQGTFEELPGLFEELKVNVRNIHDFLITAYNSGEGAIAHSMRYGIEESLVSALRAGAAKIMFDDYATIGNTDQGNIIHLYQLSGKFIPSSVIFDSLADASEVVSVKARVNLPSAIDDPGPKGWGGGSDREIKNNIYQHWNEEFKRARSESNWYASFTINVKKAVGLR